MPLFAKCLFFCLVGKQFEWVYRMQCTTKHLLPVQFFIIGHWQEKLDLLTCVEPKGQSEHFYHILSLHFHSVYLSFLKTVVFIDEDWMLVIWMYLARGLILVHFTLKYFNNKSFNGWFLKFMNCIIILCIF